MVYTCGDCGYETSRKVNFARHRNRKNPCVKTVNGNIVQIMSENANGSNLKETGSNLKGIGSNLKGIGSNLKEKILSCSKCNKTLSCKKTLQSHEIICKGIPSKICPICFKVFNTDQAKYYHINNVKCKARVSESSLDQTSIINNNTTIGNQNYIQNSNIHNNIQNNNIHINAFGKEDLSYLTNDIGIIDRLKQYGKAGIYGLPKILDEVHFKRPENGSIIKPEQFGNTVLIRNEDNEWEIREFEDVREDMIETIIKYVRMYNDTKNKLGITLSEKKERNIIKNIGYELMALDGSIPRDLFHELEMDEDNVEEDENEIKKKTRKFDKSTMHNIHVRTNNGYKKEGSDYVKR